MSPDTTPVHERAAPARLSWRHTCTSSDMSICSIAKVKKKTIPELNILTYDVAVVERRYKRTHAAYFALFIIRITPVNHATLMAR